MRKSKAPKISAEISDLPELQQMQKLQAQIRHLTPIVTVQVPVIYQGRAWKKIDLLKICHEWWLLAKKFKMPCAGMEAYLQKHSSELETIGLTL